MALYTLNNSLFRSRNAGHSHIVANIYKHDQSSMMIIPRTMVTMGLSVALIMMSMAGDASAARCTGKRVDAKCVNTRTGQRMCFLLLALTMVSFFVQ